MARYFFDVYDDGMLYPDEIGTDCTNIEEVKTEAATALGEIAKDRLPGKERYELAIAVRNRFDAAVLRTSLWFEVELKPPVLV
jgi:hypothetical protein